jgi:hypothetical protein
MSLLTSAATGFQGTERLRQKLFVVASGGLVNTSAPDEPAEDCFGKISGQRAMQSGGF